MIPRTYAHFAAACCSILLAGALSAQAADADRHGGPADDKKQAHFAALQQEQDQLERDRDDRPEQDAAATIGQAPLPRPNAQPRQSELQVEARAGGVELVFRRAAQEQPWIGVILGSLDSQLVDYAPGLPPMLGQSAVLAAAVLDPDNPEQTLRAAVRRPAYDMLGFFAQGVAFTMRGAETTEVIRAGFLRR